MEPNWSNIFDHETKEPSSAKVIFGPSYMELSLPYPYNTRTQINIKNYHSEIQYICKRKNVPRELQNTIIAHFEKSIGMVRKLEGTPAQTPKARIVNGNNSLERTNASISTVHIKEMNFLQRIRERDIKEKLDLSSNIFKKVAKEAKQAKQRKVDVYNQSNAKLTLKPNPYIYNKRGHDNPCNKEDCNAFMRKDKKRQLEQIQLALEMQNKPKINSISNFIESKKRERREEPIYQKLFRNSLQKTYKISSSVEERVNETKLLSEKPKVIEKSRKLFSNNFENRTFLERVQTQVKNRREKQQFLAMRNIDFSTNKQLFKPKTNPSKAKPRVYEYMNKSAEVVDQCKSISKCDTVQLQNRSVQIVKSQQEKYFSSIADKLFVDGKITLNADSVSKFSDSEFKIIYPFLSQIEDNKNILQTDFEQSFSKFYSKLPINQKHVLKKTAKEKKTTKKLSNSQQNFAFKPKLNKHSMKMAGTINYQKNIEFI